MERAKAGDWEQLNQVNFKALCANIRFFSECWKSVHLEAASWNDIYSPQEVDEQWGSLSGDEDKHERVAF